MKNREILFRMSRYTFLSFAVYIIFLLWGCNDNQLLSEMGDFRSLELIKEDLSLLAQKNPSCLKYNFLSKEGETVKIPWVVISDNVNQEENEPEIFINGAIHGNESLSCGITFLLIHWLVSDAREARKLRRSFEIHLVPVVNVDGFQSVLRENKNSVDLNRNFPWAWKYNADGSAGNSPADQVETQILMNFCQNRRFVLALNGHTGANNITGLWDYIGERRSLGNPSTYPFEQFKKDYMPTYDLVASLGNQYIQSVRLESAGMSSNRIDLKNFYYTEGFDWYPVFGSFSDWLFGSLGTMAFTLEYTEIQDDLKPTQKDLEQLWRGHKKALIGLIQAGGCGLSGTVLSATDSQPVNAKIVVRPIDSSGRGFDPVVYQSFCYTDSKVGDFHLMLPNGHYQYQVFVADILKQEGTVAVPSNQSLDIEIE